MRIVFNPLTAKFDYVLAPAEILAGLLTVDGAGSLLDADKLDGVEGSGYVTTASANWTDLTDGGATTLHSHAADHVAVTLDTNADALLSLSTQALGLDTQTANRVFAGPTTGAAAVPTFRALVSGDIPALNYQASDAFLTSIAALGTAADKMIYTTAVDTAAETDITSAGRAILDDSDAAAQRTTLGLVASGAGDIWVEKGGDNMTGALGINVNSSTALLIEQDGVKDNVIVVDTTAGRVGFGRAPTNYAMEVAGTLYQGTPGTGDGMSISNGFTFWRATTSVGVMGADATRGGSLALAYGGAAGRPVQLGRNPGTSASNHVEIRDAIITTLASVCPLIARGAAAQTANLQEWQNSSSVVLSSIDKDGNLTIGGGVAATDYTLTFNGETNDGVITWMEDEDCFKFSDCLQTDNGRISKISTYTDTCNILVTDETAVFNKATDFTATMPTAVLGQVLVLKNIGAGHVTISFPGADTCDEVDDDLILDQYDCVKLQCRLANKWIKIT